MIQQLRKFAKEEIWKPQQESRPKPYLFLIRLIRIVILAVKGFLENRVSLRASALTFYTLLSVVPIAAMAFGVAQGFGFESTMEQVIIDNFKGQEEVLNWIIDMSYNVLEDVEGGLLAGIGLAILLWSVMQVLTNIENSFNAIWQVKKPRTFFRKFSDYLAIMLIGPFLIILSSSVMVYISTQLNTISEEVEMLSVISPVVQSLVRLIPYALIWLLFTIVYIVMPNTRVNFKSALIAGIIAGTIFQLTQWAYIHFQVGVSKYSTLYGTFAALPLFLAWLQISWLIVLLGAEISYAYQNVDNYEFEAEALHISYHNKRLLTLIICHEIVKNFEKGEEPKTSAEISQDLSIPMRLVREIMFDLTEAHILNETIKPSPREKGYQPAIDIGRITVQYVNEKLDSFGSDQFIVKESEEFEKINLLYNDLYLSLHSAPQNKLLKDII
jgi:membrane protein